MSEFRTPVKAKAIDINEKITIPPSPFLTRLGYGTGISVMELVRSPKGGQFRSPWALKMLNKRVKPNKVYTERLQAEAELLQRMSHPNIVGFRAFSKGKILYLGMEACDLSLGDMIEKKLDEDCEPFAPKKILKAELLQRMSHPNIVGFRAFSKGKILYLGMEACDLSLGDMIEKKLDEDCEPFAPKKILKVVSDISKALEYLHTKMQILHGDIKSYNILVNGDFMICKLCDFGVTLPLDQNGVVDKEKAGKAVYFGKLKIQCYLAILN
ncbi:jg4598 [Pararge aegeria aegeria]|uniref:Jg4598 protein n=1 Tax=Pararge aegeria aegeria TaxID=348720 RepID=A0A8S4S3M7_9NEOP|nr:jg4598 [Pararge aegeria aegeria]